MTKISRRDFLGSLGVFGMGLLSSKRGQPKPDEYTVYLPTVSSCGSGDYLKLNEYSVPFGQIAPGFTFTDFPKCQKYIIEITARMVGNGLFWAPHVLINRNKNKVYEQKSSLYLTDEQPDSDDNLFDRMYLPGTMRPEDRNYPYSIKIEINNIPGMYKYYFASGSSGIRNFSHLMEFNVVGFFKSTDNVTLLDIGCNHPTGSFGAGTVISLYGVK